MIRKVHGAVLTQVGAGRSGALLAYELAALGIRHLRLVDPDRVGEENLDGIPGALPEDVGRAKVRALADGLLRFRPDMSVTGLNGSITDGQVVQALEGRADLIATCVDSDTARLAASFLARSTLTPHLDIGTLVAADEGDGRQLAADVRLLLPHEGRVACVGSLPDGEQALYELAAPPGTLHRGVPVRWDQQRAGSLITINAIAVSVGVQLWLDLLAGRSNTSACNGWGRKGTPDT